MVKKNAVINYQNGKLYKLKTAVSPLIYVGSTTKEYLCQRQSNHKANWKRYKAGKGNYISAFDLFDLGDVEIILLENFPCNSKDELHAREDYWIQQNKAICVNKNGAVRDAPAVALYAKNYHIIGRQKMMTCECGKTFQCYSEWRHIKTKKHQEFMEKIIEK